MRKITFLLLTLIFVFSLHSFSIVWAQSETEPVTEPPAQAVPPTNPTGNLFQNRPKVSGPQRSSTSNMVCIKVGEAPEEDKAAACVQPAQIDTGFIGPVVPQYCGEDLQGQPIMCIKPAYVFYCQGDPRWASTCNMSAAGCGPATMAMIFSAYGDTITPFEMDRDIFQKRGWRACGNNPSSMETAIQTLLPENGYEYKALGAPLNLERAQEYLNAGYLIIGSTSNHIFVIDGVDITNQTLRLRDPGRCENKDGVVRSASAPWNGEALYYSYAVKKLVK